MWVKICANTNLDDAVAACEAGADAVGFVFAASSRQVTPAQVAAITARLPASVERVGVFGTGKPEEIAEAARSAGLDTVQLHGGYVPETTEALRKLLGNELDLIQTIHWTIGQDDASAAVVREQLRVLSDLDPDARVLVDAKVGASPSGGTGQSFDWERARNVFAAYPRLRIILAGGLRPDNVAEAVRVLRPWGVDVASGVETAPGKKDVAKVKEFVAVARKT